MKIIFNADDFGLSKGVNLGILEACDNGVVRSTTILATAQYFDHAVVLARNSTIKVGIHLQLTSGKSLGKHKNITDKEGKFFALSVFESMAQQGKVDLDEVQKEYELQIQKVLGAGINPTHFDSHHHTHMLVGVDKVFDSLAKKYGVAARGKSTTVFSQEFYNDKATLQTIKNILQQNSQAQSIEIMCHPSFVDQTLMQTSSYNIPRTKELQILTSQDLKDFIKQNNWELCSYENIV